MNARLSVHGNRIALLVPLAVCTLVVALSLAACATGPQAESEAENAAEPEAAAEATPGALTSYYDTTLGIQTITQSEPNVPAENDPREPWLGEDAWIDAIQMGQVYIREYPQPQNVQALPNMTTGEIWVYMQHISGALGVSCQYCHDINNYAADAYPQKISGRLMLLLVGDLNSQFVTQVPQWRGNYVQCATCHRTQAQGMLAFSEENAYLAQDAMTGRSLQTWVVDAAAINPQDPNYALQHPNTGKMLEMVAWMEENWDGYVLPRINPIEEPLPRNDRRKYIAYSDVYYNVPECYTCHAGNLVPVAAINRTYLQELPDEGNTLLPFSMRGVAPETGQAP
jgi:hypothetical protein